MNRNDKKREEVKQRVLTAEEEAEHKKRIREETLRMAQIKRFAFEKELEYRKAQVQSGIVTETDEKYVGGLKPLWLIEAHVKHQEYELERINKQIEELIKQTENDRTQGNKANN